MRRASVWTKPVVDRFNELFAEDLSYTDIAARLSIEFGVEISRNAAIGFGKRHNMPKRKNPHDPRKREVRLEHRGNAPKTPVPYVPKAPIGKGTLTIVQLKPSTCRWPFGDRPPLTYCGCRVVEGHPYCEAHMQLGHVRWQPTSVA